MSNQEISQGQEGYDPFWCVIRPDHPAYRESNEREENVPQQPGRLPARAHSFTPDHHQQPVPPSILRNGHGQSQSRSNSMDLMDIVTDDRPSHHGFPGPDLMRPSSSHHSRRLPSNSLHTLDRTIASGDMTMSSDSFERLRLIESGAGFPSDDEYVGWPETYEDQKPRALESIKRNDNAAMGPSDHRPRSIGGNKDMHVSPLRSPESNAASFALTTNVKDLLKSIVKPPLEDGDVIEVGELEYPPTPGIIQPWMAVIGDKSARMPPRLTAGTLTLREVKTWYHDNRENYHSTADLYHDAMEYYFALMKQRFGKHFPSDRLAQEATILVYCGSPEKPIRMERVKTPHCYKHRMDIYKKNSNKYGVAKLPIATQQFLTAKDGPPPLDQQLVDYCTRVEKRDDLPELERKTFILYLSFTKALLDQANAGCPIAKSGLKKTNLNTSLRDLWKELSGS